MKTPKNQTTTLNKSSFNKNKKTLDLFNKHCRFTRVKANDSNDRLEILLGNCDGEIQATEERLRVLKAKRNTLVLLAQESEKLANPESEPDKYNETGLTEAILDAVNRIKNVSVSGVTAPKIRDFLIAHGFPLTENPHNFSVAVNVTLKRLADSGRVKRTVLPSGNFYRPIK